MKQKVLIGILLALGLTLAVIGSLIFPFQGAVKVLNAYSNPQLGGFWEINFTTHRKGDLQILANENTLMPQEVELEGVYCGDKKFEATTSENEIFVNDWECDGEGLLKLLVNDAGSHQMEFNFRGAKDVAHNFACNTGTLSTTCMVTSSQAMSNGETITGTGNLTITSTGSLTTSVGQSFTISLTGGASTLLIESGGSITGNVTISAVTVTVTGNINANGKGVAGHNSSSTTGSGSGGGYLNTSGDGGGGGFAGGGGNGKDTQGTVTRGLGGLTYGSLTNPVSFGSAGGTGNTTSNTSGAGGGAVKITATGTLTVGGTISANGGTATGISGNGAGGGSGGSINITAATLTGAGSIASNGGDGNVVSNIYEGGGGGGGRIALFYTTKSSFTATVTAYGGQGGNTTTDATGSQFGGAGTIYDKASASTYGDLIVGNDDQGSGSNRYMTTVGVGPTTQVTNSYTVADISIKNGAYYVVASGVSLTRTGTFASGTYLASFKVVGTFVGTSSTLTIPSALDFIVVDGSTLTSVSSLVVDSGGYFTLDSYVSGDTPFSAFSTITVNGTLQHSANTSTQEHELVLSTTTLTIGSGGSINVSGKGYAGVSSGSTNGNGPGGGYLNSNGDAGGGGFAGGGGAGRSNLGTTTRGLGGPTYGSVTNPVSIGSSGGTANTTSNTSGAGGGAIILTVSGTLTVTGTINANGGDATGASTNGAGGGSGGAINIDVGTITGAGSITSNGGKGNLVSNIYEGGGGGGGRIAITYTTKSAFTSSITAYGGDGGNTTTDAAGSQFGGAGTIYDKDKGVASGSLTVDNNHQGSSSNRYFDTVGVATSEQTTGNYTFSNVTIKNGAYYVVNSGLTFAMTGSFTSGTYLATLKMAANFTGPSSLTIPSGLDFVAVDGGGVSSVSSLTINSGGYFTLDSYVSGDTPFSAIPTITVNGILQHSPNLDTQQHQLLLSTTTLTVGSGGSINVSGKGYAGVTGASLNGYPDSAGGGYKNTNGDAGGGAYGGAGGAGKTNSGTNTRGIGGDVYGSATNPVSVGASGGTANTTSNTSGAGGGAIILTVSGTLTVTGTINANGGNATNINATGAGGGAGGAVNIDAGTITGAGAITSNGGEGTVISAVYEGGGGGGGRMMIRACNFSHSGTRTVAGGNGGNNGADGTLLRAPSCGTTLYSNNSDASAGDTNPTNLTSTTPVFSALCNDPEAGDVINKARIQVSTSPTFSSITHWDSGSSGTTITNCTAGNRIANITYGSFGTAPTLSLATNDGAVTYYWRIKFWDDEGAEGAWSDTTSTFTMNDAGGVSIDVVDASNVSLGSPSVNLSSVVYSNTSPQTATGTTPSGTNKIRVTNSSGSPAWTVSIGASGGSSSLWSNGGSATFDFNDPSGAGQLTVDPSVSTLTPVNPATSTGITKGNSTAFSNNNSVTVLSAGGGADGTGVWDLTGVGLSQLIPAQQLTGTYSLEMTITIS